MQNAEGPLGLFGCLGPFSPARRSKKVGVGRGRRRVGPAARCTAVRRAVVTVALAVAWTGIPLRGEVLDRILAVVSGHVIMQSDVRAFETMALADDRVLAGTGRTMLDYLIERQLMLEETDRYLVGEPPPADVDRGLDRVRRRFETDTAYEAALAVAGFTRDDLMQVLRDNARIRTYLDQRFASAGLPTEAEVDAYYRDHASEFVRDGQRPPAEAIREIVRQRLSDEQRTRLIDDWVAGLARRADILRVAPGP